LLTAGEFLPFAEENGLMIQISDWMLQALCRDVAQWNRINAEPVRLSLNVSPQYLDRGNFVPKLQAALAEHGIPPSQIEIEVTENICIRNPQHAAEQLHRLGEIGVSVAIDDFGTGYSSLSYLHRFPVNTIKIDQSFIREIRQADGHYPVVLAIISIAKGLGLTVVAEGVETPAQAAYLENSGCTLMQGYLYHKPLSGARFLQLLYRNAARRA
jgi:EAL domain-containing protein (putative c-di-GMP-specific phosphodiesterase class I)